MRNWKKILLVTFGLLLGLATLYIAFFFVFLDLVVDFWWFSSLDYENYFWLRLLYRYFISGGVTLVFFGIFFFHFWIASHHIGISVTNNSTIKPGLIQKFQSGALDVYTVLSLLLAVIIAIPFYKQWESSLLFLFAPSAGVDEPVYQHDVSFYMFSLPIYQLIQKELLSIASLLFVFIAILYWLEHRIVAPQRRDYPRGARIHLTFLGAFVALFIAWGFMLKRFALLYVDDHEPVFFGPGFVEIRYHLPLLWTAIVCFLIAATTAAVLLHSHGRKGRNTLIFFSVCFLAALGLRQISLIPNLINKFIVQPNPVKAEKVFMDHNITATLNAYALHEVNTVDFKASLKPVNDLNAWKGKDNLRNVPLWDRELLEDVYYQLQGMRPYYSFPTVDEDRYLINGNIRQVNLAARELNFSKLPSAAHTWENMHLRYTQGYGAVMTPAAQEGDRPQEWYLRDLSLSSAVGFDIERPDIYYGLESYQYAIVPNKLDVVGLSKTAAADSQEGTAKNGIPIHSLFRKLLLALYFRDEKIFFSLNITDDSRVRFRRNIIERIETLTPYLALDDDPYLVVTSKGFFWIQDAYTLSRHYPVSKPSRAHFRSNKSQENREFNYIRNSVKIVVNAYDGSVDYYIVDDKDPIIAAYNRAYPGLLKDAARMPEELKSHLRYPRDLFAHQMSIYTKYHQTEPELFYQQAETWEFATASGEVIKPYFLTTELDHCEGMQEFVLINPMTPVGRDNLSGLAIAGIQDQENCGNSYKPHITLFQMNKDIQVDGPAQISALIDQDPLISEQFTLWDQHGSEVRQGRMIILPVGKTVLYVQPIYLISTRTKIPELTRVIVAAGGEVVMEKSSEQAFARLEQKLKAASAQPELKKQTPGTPRLPELDQPAAQKKPAPPAP